MNRYTILMNCAEWSSEQARTAYLAAQSKSNDQDYYQRRAIRLQTQADNLRDQAIAASMKLQ